MTVGEAEARTRLFKAFDGREFVDGERRLIADAVVGSAADLGIETWLWFDTPHGAVAAVVLRLDGGPSGWAASRQRFSASPSLIAMGRLEFLLQTLEGDGPAWTPVRFAAAEGLCARLDLKDEGRLVHQLALRVPDDACDRLGLAAPPDLSRAPASACLPAALVLPGPLVPLAELSSLSEGDLVWLAEGDRLQACLRIGDGTNAEGLFDPVSRQFLLAAPLRPDPRPSGETTMIVEATEGAGAGDKPAAAVLEDIPVRLSFEFGPWPARLADIAAIGPGAVLSALADEAEPRVRITVEGRVLAHGRLVTVGRSYGVLVDSVER